MSKTTYKTNCYLTPKTLQKIRLAVARRTQSRVNKVEEKA